MLMYCYLLFPQPQSTDFTQYNSYGDMGGGGRGEGCNQNVTNNITEFLPNDSRSVVRDSSDR